MTGEGYDRVKLPVVHVQLVAACLHQLRYCSLQPLSSHSLRVGEQGKAVESGGWVPCRPYLCVLAVFQRFFYQTRNHVSFRAHLTLGKTSTRRRVYVHVVSAPSHSLITCALRRDRAHTRV